MIPEGLSPVPPELLRKLREGPAPVRVEAIEELARIGTPEAIEAIREALRDPIALVAREAACALGKLRASGAAEDLAAALACPDFSVRRAAARALVRIGPPAVPALLRAIRDPDQPWRARREALWALAEIPGPEAEEAMGQLADNPHPAIRDIARWRLGGEGRHAPA